MASPPEPSNPSAGEGVTCAGQSLGGRYQILAELGRGGMAAVYRALDAVSGRELALKQLTLNSDAKRLSESALLFEREFHVLTEISHPRVIEVYDYGLEPSGAYYTMELLDGGDLRERSPLDWREACELIYDVCSSLALLHSRRLVHRDVSPRNVRCTRDGHAKLIDFGAMVPMGAAASVVGTPAFVAPEVVHGAGLDARTDLFSLGATFYFALTGRLAYPARDFSQLRESWSHKPAPPSATVAGIPSALDALVASLISLEPALRPRSAFEVMQRLSAIAGIERSEPLGVSKAYLASPTLVGREQILAEVLEHLERARHGVGQGLLIAGAPGSGRSRVLDSCVLSAKMRGATVVYTAADSSSDFGSAERLARGLLEAVPEAAQLAARRPDVFERLFDSSGEGAPRLRSFSRTTIERPALQRALVKWFVHVSRQKPLVVALDNADRADEATVALIAALAEKSRDQALLVLASAEIDGGGQLRSNVLRSRCKLLSLAPLDLAQTEQLLGSVFGDVPNLALLSRHLHGSAAGNPRQIMELAQHLVDRGTISYEAGGWSLPEALTSADLPADAAAALRARIARLGPLARRLAETHALAPLPGLSRDEYSRLAHGESALHVEQALDELRAGQLIASQDGGSYHLTQPAIAQALRAELNEPACKARHLALAELYEQRGDDAFIVGRELLFAGELRGLDMLVSVIDVVKGRIDVAALARVSPEVLAQTFREALRVSEAEGRALREQFELRYSLMLVSVEVEDELYWQVAPVLRARLELDSGWREWRACSDITDPNQRLMTALTRAVQRHESTPQAERVFAPDQAIRLLGHYVAVSLAVSARTMATETMESLPPLLEPFAALSPLLAALWQNARASCESTCYRQAERALERWREVYAQLGSVSGAEPEIVQAIRSAVAFGIGINEAALGRESAAAWTEILDADPMQRVSAMYLRKVIRLQQGDLEGAERCRRQAELLALQARTRSMFTNLLALEIGVHAASWDLTGVKQTAARIEQLAQQYAGWVPFRHLAQGHYQRLRGDYEEACRAYERCLAISTPKRGEPSHLLLTWPLATSAYVETLVALDRAAEAKARAQAVLDECLERDMIISAHEVSRALALAEAKLGEHTVAAARLDELIRAQLARGVRGLNLGASYEARARVAIWAGDTAAVEHFGRLTAEQYRHGSGSPLGARYEALMNDARGAGVLVLPALSRFESTVFGTTDLTSRTAALGVVVSAMLGATDRATRASRALALLCEASGVRAGYLYLSDGEKLRLLATQGIEPPDDVIHELVDASWIQEHDDELATDTQLLRTETLSSSSSGSHVWTDRNGTAYEPLMLRGRRTGTIESAGLALLCRSRQSANDNARAELAAELAGFLLRSGDSIIRAG